MHTMLIGGKVFDVEKHCYVMGILNLTPDSFSDGGQWNDMDQALFHTETMILDGMDILDIGGESTRPGHTVISDDLEIERIVPVVEAIRLRFDIPISVDTYKSAVAKAALSAGAHMINDIWGLRKDSDMATVIAQGGGSTMQNSDSIAQGSGSKAQGGGSLAQHEITCCLMHNRERTDYRDFMTDMLEDLRQTVTIAKSAGINDRQIILDPGIGFAKSHAQNLQAINRIDQLKVLGYPVLLGTSRKRVVGETLNLPVSERVEGTIATTVAAVLRGCSFVRVHDVKENKRAILMTEAILGTSQ